MLNPNTKKYLNHALKWGAISGVCMTIYMLIISSSGEGASGLQTTGFVQYMILSFGIYFCQRSYFKIADDTDKIKTGKLFWLGLLCGLAASLVVDLYVSYYVKANPSIVNETIEQSQQLLSQMGLYSKADLETATELSKKMFGPMLVISNSIVYLILSAMFSGISAWLSNFNRNKNIN